MSKKEVTYTYLKGRQDKYGGYTGNDITRIGTKLGIPYRTMFRLIQKWKITDPKFSEFVYIGKQSIELTLKEIAFIEEKLKNNCLRCTPKSGDKRVIEK